MTEALARNRLQTVLVTYFPMFIATLSLCTSIYNGYLNNQFIDLIKNNTARVKSLHTCKEIIDAYFQVKFRVSAISGGTEGVGPQADAANAVTRFAALGTYLANLRDDATRQRYTGLTEELEKIVAQAPRTPRDGIGRLFETADRLFGSMNDDCVTAAKNTPI